MARYALVSPDDQIIEFREYAEPPIPHKHANKPRLLPVEEKNEAVDGEVAFVDAPVVRKTKVVITTKSRAKTVDEAKQDDDARMNVCEEIRKIWAAIEALRV